MVLFYFYSAACVGHSTIFKREYTILGFFRIVYSRLKMVEWPKYVAEEKQNRTIENFVAGTATPLVYTRNKMQTTEI
jgi:hypothetical protein